MAHRREVRAEDRVFIFCLDNLPIGFTWQDLKDLVRTGCNRQGGGCSVGFVDVSDLHTQNNVRQVGSFPVKLRGGVPLALFAYLEAQRNVGMTIDLFETTSRSPVLLRSTRLQRQESTPGLGQTMMRLHESWINTTNSVPSLPHTAVIVNGGPIMREPPSPPYHVGSFVPVPQLYNLETRMTDMHINMHIAHPAAALPVQPIARLPVNTSRGVIQTQSTAIHISGLNPRTTRQALDQYLHEFARPTSSCHLNKDDAGRAKWALARYETPEDAMIAVACLNNKVFLGKMLRVKPDNNQRATPESVPSSCSSSRSSSSKKHDDPLRVQAQDSSDEGPSPPISAPRRAPLILDGSSGRRHSASS